MPSLAEGNGRVPCGFDVEWPLSLEEFGARLASAMSLPAFDYDAENVYEWGQTLTENGLVEVNISRKHGWDGPPSSTLSVILIVSKDAPAEWDKAWLSENLLPQFAVAVSALSSATA